MSDRSSERARIAADQRRRTEVEARYKAAQSLRPTIEKAAEAAKPRRPVEPIEARAARAAAELSAAYRKISPADRATIDHVYLTRGWPAVRQALLQAQVVSAEALSLADGIVQRGGLEGLGAAIQARVQSEDVATLQATAEQEAVGALANLSEAQWSEAERINAAGGPQAVFAAAQSVGLSPAAAMVVARTVQSHGVAGTRHGVTERAQRDEAQAEARAASERTAEAWTPKEGDSRRDRAVKEGSPIAAMMRDPAFHAQAEALAARLEATGLTRAPGSSAADYVMDALYRLDGGRVVNAARKPFEPKWSEAQQLQAVTALLGSDSPASVRKALSGFETARTGHQLVDRMASRDKHPAPPKPAPNPLRSTIEKASSKGSGLAKPVGVGTALGAQIAIAAGLKPERDVRSVTPHGDREMERIATDMENPRPDTSLRGAIEAAMHDEEDEKDNAEGGTDE